MRVWWTMVCECVCVGCIVSMYRVYEGVLCVHEGVSMRVCQ